MLITRDIPLGHTCSQHLENVRAVMLVTRDIPFGHTCSRLLENVRVVASDDQPFNFYWGDEFYGTKTKVFPSLKARANDHNMLAQHHPTLLG